MKKLSILAAILAIETMCIAGCNMGGANSAKTPVPETHNIALQEEHGEGEQTPTPCPDDNCDHGKMPFKKPTFRFKAPHDRHDGKGRGKFRRPHNNPAPEPENPEIPETPAENENN